MPVFHPGSCCLPCILPYRLITPSLSLSCPFQGKKVTVTDKDVYTLTGVTRDDSGLYKCSLLDNDVMESTQIVTVSCEWEKDAFFFSISLPSLPKGTYTLEKDLMERLTDMERSFWGFGKSRVSLKPSNNTENWSSKCILWNSVGQCSKSFIFLNVWSHDRALLSQTFRKYARNSRGMIFFHQFHHNHDSTSKCI